MNTTFYGSPLIKEKRIHPVKGRDSAPCVTVGKGWWKEKIYHFLPDQPPSSDGDEIQTEFFISYSDFKAAMETLY
jgi:xylitol oxidase